MNKNIEQNAFRNLALILRLHLLALHVMVYSGCCKRPICRSCLVHYPCPTRELVDEFRADFEEADNE